MKYWYEVIAEPPFETGAENETLSDPLPLATDVIVGAPGIVAGVIAADWRDVAPVPAAFVARTLNVYDVPFVKPVIEHDVVVVTHVCEPGVEVTV
jgi:hypothetical protein